MNNDSKYFKISDEHKGERVDSFLAGALSISRNQAQKLIDSSSVFLGELPVNKNYRLLLGDTVAVSFFCDKPEELVPENIPFAILYEDEFLAIVEKPKGILTHPTSKETSGTLVNALLHRFSDSLSTLAGELRPGIVHRLDRDTSGLLIVAKNNKVHQRLDEQMRCREISRKYQGIAQGRVEPLAGLVDAPIIRQARSGNKRVVVEDKNSSHTAQTHYSVIEHYDGFSHVEAELITGRTHQIRVHFQHIGHPLVGDTVYGHISTNNKFPQLKGQCLHSYFLSFDHPVEHKKMQFESKLPDYFADTLKKIKRG